MANANGSGTPATAEDDQDRVERSPEMQGVVDKWFAEDPKADTELSKRGWFSVQPGQPLVFANETARRMNEQRRQGKPTTGRRGCWFSFAVPAVAAVLAGWAVR